MNFLLVTRGRGYNRASSGETAESQSFLRYAIDIHTAFSFGRFRIQLS
jgi:hypothetical protein